MQDGFIKVAAGTPTVKVGNCAANSQQIINLAKQAAAQQAKLLVTPELGITAYTCGDLFLQDALLIDAEQALLEICKQTAALPLLLVVGLPLRHRGKLYNCAAVVRGGRVLGIVPKSYPPNYGEHSELRYFSPAFAGVERLERGLLRGVPIGVQIMFRCDNMPSFVLAVEICEDLWAPAPPSIFHSAAGATVMANLSAKSEAVGESQKRRELVCGQSGRLLCGYVFANAGSGESTTDLVFAGHSIVAENGAVLAETAPFNSELAISEIDVNSLLFERQRITGFADAGGDGYLNVLFTLPMETTELSRSINSTPCIPGADDTDAYNTIMNIQSAAVQKRISYARAEKAVIGVSGGLDSTLALLVTADAFTAMGRSSDDIIAVAMPGFGTTQRTHDNAKELCELLKVRYEVVDITSTTRMHFEDIGHSENEHDAVYENAQARMRTMVLMDIANRHGGLVVGTGDLSELALGWATFNGDHMSMYAVNGGVSKTLVRYMVQQYANSAPPALAKVLLDVLQTPVSPELLPPDSKGNITQQTEQLIGPYEIHDFFLYYVLRWGFEPQKIMRLAEAAFKDEYSHKQLLGWMKVFYRRFFSQQYKRNCMPDGPKVDCVSLSPRGGLCMPSDACAEAWLRRVEELA